MSHVNSPAPPRDIQPPRLVQFGGTVGRTDRAGRGPHRRGADARRGRRPDRPAPDRADAALRPLRHPRRPAGRPHLPPFADGGRRGAAGRGPCSDRAAARARRAQSAAAGAARLCRRVRHRRLQRGRASAGALAGEFGPLAGGQCADRARTHHRLRQRACAWRRAGGVVGWGGASPAFGFAAALSAMAVVLLSGIYEPARTSAPRRHPFQDIREGAAFVFHHPLLRPVFITQFIFNTGWFLQIAVFVPYAVRHLGLTAAGVGTVLTMYGVGMVIGALFATRVMKRIAFGTGVGLGPGRGFVAAVVMALTVLVPSPWLAALSFFLLGVGPILWVISTTTLRQSVTPPRLLRRVSAINIMSYGARPVGSALGAVVGGLWSAEACLYLAAAVFGVQALVIWLSPAVVLDRQPDMVGDEAVARC